MSALQRRSPGGVYGWLQATLLLLGVYALREDSDQVAVLVIAMCGLTVILPATLDQIAKAAFARGRAIAAVRLFSWRATLMPGAGLSRQQDILHALELYDLDGADAAVGYLAELEASSGDEAVRAVICEQRVAILFQAGRWDDGIKYYNQAFHPNYAALRPALALGLLRAYGESGDLERAATVLRLLEESVLATDPRARGLLGQAQLTYLAYAGATTWVERFIQEGATGKIGISAAGDELYRGIAWARAGDLPAAKAAFGRVCEVATAKDFQVLNAAQRSLSGLETEETQHPLATLVGGAGEKVEHVAARIQALFASGLELRVSRWPLASLVLIVLLVVGYFAYAWSGGGVRGLASSGALIWYANPLGASREWFGVLTNAWVHGDPIILALNCYAIWSSGRIVEPRSGGSVFVAVCLLGGLVGTMFALLVVHSFPVTLWGGGFIAMAAVGVSLPTGGRIARRSGPKSARRWYMIIGMFASGLSLSVVGLLGWRAGLCGSALAFASGLGCSILLLRRERSTRWVWPARALLTAVTAGTVAAFIGGARASADSAATMGAPCVHDGVYFSDGLGAFRVQERAVDVFALPVVDDALVDEIALRTGSYVQLIVLPATTSSEALLRPTAGKNPQVFGSLMPGFNERFSVKRRERADAAAGQTAVAVWEIYRGGEVIAEAWLVREDSSAPVVALLGAPFGALSGVDRPRYVAVAGAGPRSEGGMVEECASHDDPPSPL